MKNVMILVWILSVLSVSAFGNGMTVGDKAEEFSLLDVRTGKNVSLSALNADKGVAVIFIATGCPYSNAFNKVMSEVASRYEGKGIQFVGINSNKTEPADQVRVHAEENSFPFPVLKDEGNIIADRFGATVTPEVFLLDDDLELKYHGAIGNSRQPTTDAAKANSDELAQALEALLSGTEIPVKTTKMFGCTIKR